MKSILMLSLFFTASCAEYVVKPQVLTDCRTELVKIERKKRKRKRHYDIETTKFREEVCKLCTLGQGCKNVRVDSYTY